MPTALRSALTRVVSRVRPQPAEPASAEQSTADHAATTHKASAARATPEQATSTEEAAADESLPAHTEERGHHAERPPRAGIAVTNTVALHGGDAAIAVAIVESVRRAAPGACIELHDSQPAAVARYHPSLQWKPSLATIGQLTGARRRGARLLGPLNNARLLAAACLWRRRLTRPLGAALLREGERLRLADFPAIDLVISTGGTYLVEQYGIGSRVFELLMAGALGVPVVFYTQSLGPFRARRNRPRLRMVFSASPLVLLRDERSRRHLRDLGVPGAAVHVVADAVFGRERARPFAQPVAKRVRSVAVSVREWPPGADAAGPAMVGFRRAVAAAVTGLVGQHSADVTFLSTCQGIPEYWTVDSTVAEAVAAELPEDVRRRVRVDRAFHGPDALAEAYAAFDMVLATRMHAAILALTAGTPVLPIAYEFKTTELFEALGLGDYVVSIDGIDDDRLLACTRVFVDELPGLIGICRASVEAERAQARRAEGDARGRGRAVEASRVKARGPATSERERPVLCGGPATRARRVTPPRE